MLGKNLLLYAHKEREAEALLRQHFGPLEPVSPRILRVSDGRRIYYAYSRVGLFFLRSALVNEELDANDLIAFVITDEERQRVSVCAVPVATLSSAFDTDSPPDGTSAPAAPSYRVHLTVATDGDGRQRFKQIDLDLEPYRIIDEPTTLVPALVGLEEPPSDLVERFGLPSEKLQRLLRWRLDGTEESGEHFDFSAVRRRLHAIQTELRRLDDPEDAEAFTEAGWRRVLDNIHAASRTKGRAVQDNDIAEVRRQLRLLLSDDATPIDARLQRLDLRYVGDSVSGELLCWFDPDRYPLRNGAAEAGLAFFGYEVDGDYTSFQRAFEKFRGIYEQALGRLQPDIPLNLEIDQLFNQIHKVDLRADEEQVERFWRITLPDQGEYASVWANSLEHAIAAVSFSDADPDDPQLRQLQRIRPGDWVVAFLRQKRIGGIGKVKRGYEPGDEEGIPPSADYWGGDFLRRIEVEWFPRTVSVEELSQGARNKFLAATVIELTPAQFAEVRALYSDLIDPSSETVDEAEHAVVAYTVDDFMRNTYQADRQWYDEVAELLRDKGQIILYGPPGTGKTFLAREFAKALIGADPPDDDRFQIIQFHPGYSYEEFIEGIRPESREIDGRRVIDYPIRPGAFRDFCTNAMHHDKPSVFVIDEINRGNIASIFGELLYALEYRGEQMPVRLPYSGMRLSIPDNVYIIGTMNTADRSISLMDFALRRRFHFVRCAADVTLLERWLDGQSLAMPHVLPLYRLLCEAIEDPDYQIGMSYFMDDALTDERLGRIWRRSIEPYLETYFLDDPAQAARLRWDGSAVQRLREAHRPAAGASASAASPAALQRDGDGIGI